MNFCFLYIFFKCLVFNLIYRANKKQLLLFKLVYGHTTGVYEGETGHASGTSQSVTTIYRIGRMVLRARAFFTLTHKSRLVFKVLNLS